MQDLMLAIIKTERIPGRMFTPPTIMKILMPRSIKTTHTLKLILYRMRMNKIHYYRNASTMCSINQSLQFLRCAIARRRCKETRYMISERAIIRMLLNSHQLNRIISSINDTRQNINPKLIISTNATMFLRHTYMRFIDQRRHSLTFKRIILPAVRLSMIPDLRIKYLGIMILHHTSRIHRDTFTTTALPMHLQLIQLTMLQRICRQIQFPHTLINPAQRKFRRLLPITKLTYQCDRFCIWRPLPKHPPILITMQTKILMTRRKIR